jgi:hypothetical protein
MKAIFLLAYFGLQGLCFGSTNITLVATPKGNGPTNSSISAELGKPQQ